MEGAAPHPRRHYFHLVEHLHNFVSARQEPSSCLLRLRFEASLRGFKCRVCVYAEDKVNI